MEDKRMKMNCNLCFHKLIKQLGWQIWKKKNIVLKNDLWKNRYIEQYHQYIYINSFDAIYLFLHKKKVATKCVSLEDEYIDGDFGCGVLKVSSP